MDLTISNARLRGRTDLVDVGVADGRIATIAPARTVQAAREIPAGGGLVTPSFVEPHCHIDKTLTRDRLGAVSPEEAFARAREVKSEFTVEDVERRASRALEMAVANGIGKMRTQCDVDFATRLVSFEGLLRARERFSHLIDVEIVAFPQEGIVSDPQAPELLRDALRNGASAVGGLAEIERSVEDQRAHLEQIFRIAEEFNVPVDVHADYLDSPDLRTLELLADVTIERGFEGRVVAGHCCALAVYPDDEAARVIEKVKLAQIDVVVMPVGNLQMLGGPKRTPYNRGSSRVLELLDAGVNVAAAGDNVHDIWTRFSRYDPVETSLLACLSAGMRTDDEVETAFDLVTVRADRAIGGDGLGVTEGAPADLVVFEAQTTVDVLRNLPGKRTVLKNGRIVGGVEARSWTAV
jgi:cytosine/creatinine deaminase